MTVSLNTGEYKILFSDSVFKSKPTISVYNDKMNVEQKVASFTSQEAFEWFVNKVLGVIDKNIQIVERSELREEENTFNSAD